MSPKEKKLLKITAIIMLFFFYIRYTLFKDISTKIKKIEALRSLKQKIKIQLA